MSAEKYQCCHLIVDIVNLRVYLGLYTYMSTFNGHVWVSASNTVDVLALDSPYYRLSVLVALVTSEVAA